MWNNHNWDNFSIFASNTPVLINTYEKCEDYNTLLLYNPILKHIYSERYNILYNRNYQIFKNILCSILPECILDISSLSFCSIIYLLTMYF